MQQVCLDLDGPEKMDDETVRVGALSRVLHDHLAHRCGWSAHLAKHGRARSLPRIGQNGETRALVSWALDDVSMSAILGRPVSLRVRFHCLLACSLCR